MRKKPFIRREFVRVPGTNVALLAGIDPNDAPCPSGFHGPGTIDIIAFYPSCGEI